MYSANPHRVDRILAVDDVPDNLFLLQAILEDQGYEVCLVGDGEEALAEIDRNPPDLVLLDIMMPGIDGYEVTRRIRQKTHLPMIPVLLISAHDQASPAEGLDAGADDFIRKPVDVDELLARVRSLLRLKHSIEEREEIARQREDFISRLTHDLRTPLVAADRMLNLMRQGTFCHVSLDMDKALSSMIRSNQNLLQMVNTLLEVHRHESGNKTLLFSLCNLHDIVREVSQELSPLANEKGLALNLILSPINDDDESMGMVVGDRLELRRVVTNLIGNAIKFTDRGAVTVSLGTVPTNSGNSDHSAWVILEVRDTGPGIPAGDQALLFERFRQGNHKRAGSGLGLHLSRRIIEAHNGCIKVASELGQGSVFTVQLPSRAAVPVGSYQK
ncbi:MAG TPA: hybrid sensor histidine kinase/response regulator [Chroococcidiopsis sp.]